MSAQKVKILTEENFDSFIQNKVLAIIDCWAPWCGPCNMFSPIIEELAEQHSKLLFGKLNVDENMSLAGKFGIMAIPTTLFFREGNLIDTVVGFVPKSVLEDKIRILTS